MIALLEWTPPEGGKREIRETSVLHLRLLRVTLPRGRRTPEAVLRRRVLWAGKKLRKLGVTQAVLPEGFTYGEQLAKYGVRPVTTLPLRQALAADWVDWILERRGIAPAGAKIAISAQRLTGEVVRTVTELSLRHRYLLLEVPYGGEELCSQLRREYGVSLLLEPSKEQLEGADALVLFDPKERLRPRQEALMALYDESAPLPPIGLPPALEEILPGGADRGQILSALREAGALKTGQMVLGGKRT